MHVAMRQMRDVAHEMAVFHGHELRRGLGQKIPVVGDDDPGRGQRMQNLDDALPGLRVQAVGGFVQQEDPGPHGQDRGQGHELFFAAGQAVGQAALESGQAELFQGPHGPLPRLVHGQAQIQRPEGHVIKHRGIEELVFGVLQDQTHFTAQGSKFLFPAQRLPVKKHPPLLRSHQSGDDMKEGGLAAAVGAVESGLLTGDKGEAHVVQDSPARGVGEGDIFESEDWGFRHEASPGKDP